MFAVEPGLLGPNLRALGQSLTGLRAIVIVSPHWSTLSPKVTTTRTPETIHDFGGFPDVLYSLQYNPPGDPDIAAQAMALLRDAGVTVNDDPQRGLDHGAWVPLLYFAPDQNIPVVQVSLPHRIGEEGAFALGRALRPLRDMGVMVIGSGSLTHNLYEFRQHISDPEYADEFAQWIRQAVERNDRAALIEYRRRAPHAERAHPTDEHYVPLLVALGAADDDEIGTLVEGGMTYGTLSMDSFGFGLPA